MKERILMLNGGGFDSLAMAIQYKDQEVHSLHINLGFPNSEATEEAAYKIANYYCHTHKVITVDGLIDGSFVPRHHQILVTSMAISYATRNGITKIISGANGICNTKDFLDAINAIIKSNQKHDDEIILEWPLEGFNSPEAIYPLVKDSPIFDKVVSCNRNPVCNICHKCRRFNKIHQLRGSL